MNDILSSVIFDKLSIFSSPEPRWSPNELSKLKQSTKIGQYEFNDSTVSEFCNILLCFQNEKSVKQLILIMSSRI